MGAVGGSSLAAMLAMITGNQACAAFLYMTLSMLRCYLLNGHMDHNCLEAVAWCRSFSQVLFQVLHELFFCFQGTFSFS